MFVCVYREEEEEDLERLRLGGAGRGERERVRRRRGGERRRGGDRRRYLPETTRLHTSFTTFIARRFFKFFRRYAHYLKQTEFY